MSNRERARAWRRAGRPGLPDEPWEPPPWNVARVPELHGKAFLKAAIRWSLLRRWAYCRTHERGWLQLLELRLREVYTHEWVESLIFRQSPLLALIPETNGGV